MGLEMVCGSLTLDVMVFNPAALESLWSFGPKVSRRVKPTVVLV